MNFKFTRKTNHSFIRTLFRKRAFPLLVLFLISNYASGSLFAQLINLKERNVSVQVILEKLKKQTGYDFLGDMSILKNAKPVSIQVSNAKLDDVLQIIADGQQFYFSLYDKTILVKPKANQPSRVPKTNNNSGLAKEQPTYTLTGTVKGENGQGLDGVTVQDAATGKSLTLTNKEGAFTVSVNSNMSLRFSFLGYESATISVDGRREIQVVLKSSKNEIEETVVTGYGTLRRESFTGAAKTITRKELEKFNTGNIFSLLQTLDPSFKVDERVDAGSNPNALPEINIRGVSSVGEYAVNAPLVILDGFEVELKTLYDLDVNRIESISILKDASSTSLYGSRGGNGVIVIETRLPKDGKFTITYDAKPSTSIVDLTDYNLMNAAEKLEYERLAGIYISKTNSPDWQLIEQEMFNNLYNNRLRNVQEGVDTYWLKQPVRNSFSVNNSIRMEGGGNDVRYSLEGNYHDYKGVMKESGRKRGGASFNLIYRIPNVITFRNIASYQYTKAYNSPYGKFSTYAYLNPYERIFDDNGNYNIRFGELGSYYSFGEAPAFNPLYNATLGFKDQEETQFISNNLSLEWLINDNFKLNARASISRNMTSIDQYKSPFHTDYYLTTDALKKGSYHFGDSAKMAYEGRVDLQYSKSFNKHQITANAMTEVRSSTTNGNFHTVTGYADDRFITPQMALGYELNSLPKSVSIPIREIGFLGSLFYTYDNRYNLSLTGRSDGASIYGKQNRFGNFWSAGASYNMHNEDWFRNEYVNRLRVFANVGTNSTVSSFNAGMVSTSYDFVAGGYYNNQYAALYALQGNPALRWPEQKQTSVGVDFSLLQNLLNLNVSLYDRTTNRMISPITVAPSFGFGKNMYFQNLGKASNRGFEIEANVRIMENPHNNFSWFFNAAAVQNRSKLLEISNELRELNESLVQTDANGNVIKPSTYYEVGQSLTVIRAVPSLGIDPSNGRELYRDLNGNVTYTWNPNNQVVVGNREADLYGSMGTTLNYKGLSVQINSVYSIGGDVFNSTLMDKIENNSPYLNADKRVLEERWKEPGDQALYKAINDLTRTQISSRFVQVENFLRISSINVNYNFGTAFLDKYKLQRLKLNFSMNDPFRFSSVGMERGISYPYAREYNLGLMVQF